MSLTVKAGGSIRYIGRSTKREKLNGSPATFVNATLWCVLLIEGDLVDVIVHSSNV